MATNGRTRTVRAHAVRPGDDLKFEHVWWNVRRVLVPNETVRWRDKGDWKEQTISDFDPNVQSALLVRRGSRHFVVYLLRVAVVSIIRRNGNGNG